MTSSSAKKLMTFQGVTRIYQFVRFDFSQKMCFNLKNRMTNMRICPCFSSHLIASGEFPSELSAGFAFSSLNYVERCVVRKRAPLQGQTRSKGGGAKSLV